MRIFRRLPLLIIILLAACQAAAPQPQPTDPGGATMTFILNSPAFKEGETIPTIHTCEGQDRSPELRWSDAPANARSFVLIVDDPDAPGGTFTHWVLFDIPAATRQLAEAETAIGAAGRGDFGRAGYGGPCPPRGGGSHRYFFKVYALDVASLNLKQGAARRDVETAMKGHILAQAQLMGRYERR